METAEQATKEKSRRERERENLEPLLCTAFLSMTTAGGIGEEPGKREAMELERKQRCDEGGNCASSSSRQSGEVSFLLF